MTEPVCQLDDFHFTKLAVQWHAAKMPEEFEVNYAFDYQIGQHKTDKNRYRLAFQVGLKSDTPEPLGYHLNSEIVGFFQFPEGTEQKKMDFLIRVNGCSVLYGILRGQVASMTGSFAQKKLVLPTLMMKEIIEGVEHRRAAQAKTKKSAPKATSRKKRTRS